MVDLVWLDNKSLANAFKEVIEQCLTESLLGQGRNKERNWRLPKIQLKMNAQCIQNYGTWWKQC